MGEFCNLEVNQDVPIMDADSAREDSWYRTGFKKKKLFVKYFW